MADVAGMSACHPAAALQAYGGGGSSSSAFGGLPAVHPAVGAGSKPVRRRSRAHTGFSFDTPGFESFFADQVLQMVVTQSLPVVFVTGATQNLVCICDSTHVSMMCD